MKDNVEHITSKLREIVVASGKNSVVVGVSGGIDSALTLTLATRALGPSHVHPLLLPYGEQRVDDSLMMCSWNKIMESSVEVINIKLSVDLLLKQLTVDDSDLVRAGNIMARVRMITLFDRAKRNDSLVVGTENKSERMLGYFTRFGDEASDIEPISHLYKTQVRAMAAYLEIPETILNKDPSAELWEGQTDEKELGFTYEQADRVLYELVEGQQHEQDIEIPGLSAEVVRRVCNRVQAQSFKTKVPYRIES